MPTVIREFARAKAGEVGAIAVGVFSSGALLTAVRNGSDNLELIVWSPDSTNLKLTRVSDSGTQAGEVGEVSLTMLGNRCLTAVQTANGKLLLIPWALEPDGTLSRLESVNHQAGTASYLAIASLSETLAITAVRNGAGNLLLIPWSVDAATAHVSRLNNDSAQGGSVGSANMYHPPNVPALEGPLIACAAIDDSHFISAKVNAGGGLEIAAWALGADFTVLPGAQSAVSGLADYLGMAPLGNPGPVRDFVVAYRNITIAAVSPGDITFKKELVLSIWRASTEDQTISQITEARAGELAAVGIAVGEIGRNDRPMILVSAHSGDSLLLNLAFQLISDSTGGVALVYTGDVDDSAYSSIFDTRPVSLAGGQFATAIGHDAGLGIVAYQVSDLSATLIRPLAEATAGDSSAIRIQALSSDQAVVALRNGSGKLELISWSLTPSDFAVRRAADTTSHPIDAQEVALAVIGQRAVTAIRSGSGRLRLDSWDISANLASINWLHETGTAAGNADIITAALLEPDLIVTAVRNASGKLLLIVWRLESDGSLSRLNHENAQAGKIDEICLVSLDAANVVTAVRNGSGHLQVIGWHIDSNGIVTRWATDGNAGDARALAIAALGGSGSTRDIVTAVRDGSDQLFLIVWRVSIDNRTVDRLTDSGDQGHDGAASNLSLCIVQSPPSDRQNIVSAQRRESGNLKLASWKLLEDTSGIPMLVQTGSMTNRADTDVRFTDCCSPNIGRMVVAANLNSKHNDGLWLSTIQVRDAQAPATPTSLLEVRSDSLGPPISPDTSWAKSDGKSYPEDRSFEWAQVQDPNEEYDDATLICASGWIVAPEDSGGDVPFSHPFGFDWEFSIALDAPSRGLLSPANASAEEGDVNPNHNSIALADQLGLTVPEGLLGLEWDKNLLPASYRGQVNHGDRIAVLGRWILDQGHDVDGFYRTEVHPPLLIASAAVVQPTEQKAPRTRVLFMSRPYLSGQTFTTNLDTRYQDGVDDDGPLLSPLFSSHSFKELFKVLTFRSWMVEMHPKIKSKPFRGSHQAQFVVRPSGPSPASGAQLLVSYRFTVRTPCSVAVEPMGREAVLVTVELLERAGRREYQPPDLPVRSDETYSTDELDLLSSGSGDQVAFGERMIEMLVALFSIFDAAYIRYILGRGVETDVFEPLPDIDILDPSGGVFNVPLQKIVAGAGVVVDDNQHYPIVGWLETHWAPRIG